MTRLLDVRDLQVAFDTEDGVATVVDGISFHVDRGETLCLVGESGCGKSMTALAMLRLVPPPNGRIAGGAVTFQGRDLLALPERDMRQLRGNEIAMVFQEPMTALNPVFTIGNQIAEAITAHQSCGKREVRARVIELLRKVGIASPEERAESYPHQLSGGMKQRAMIAMALACSPKLLIADEPTTALDVTIQAQILALLAGLKSELGMALLFITHDLGVVAEMADRVAVMYAARIVESASAQALFARPAHPYTIGLFRSLPRMDQGEDRLTPIPGVVPDPLDYPSGCRFRTRCPFADARCAEEDPALREIEPGHLLACHHPQGELGSRA
jgi:peptide/nickel transport system ATP-binding protein